MPNANPAKKRSSYVYRPHMLSRREREIMLRLGHRHRAHAVVTDARYAVIEPRKPGEFKAIRVLRTTLNTLVQRRWLTCLLEVNTKTGTSRIIYRLP